MEKAENLVELIEAQTHVWNAMFHFKKSACLGIPDVISNHGKPITLSDLISVIIIDSVMGSQIQDETSFETEFSLDMQMLVMLGPAKERTGKEWSKLFSDAGFSSYKVYPVLGMRCLIEVYP
ncbi:unnamed protein product [Coffea canephora]|uniref:DH200=94 genomic scaffold, scaffold_1411 n=1 Tax=Coffea canephora TaxID=49390 RepID=A0A068VJ25_COFCA|nr:unnamed protein product [Coffea canephora]